MAWEDMDGARSIPSEVRCLNAFGQSDGQGDCPLHMLTQTHYWVWLACNGNRIHRCIFELNFLTKFLNKQSPDVAEN